MQVELLDYMGNDLTVVNAARVSFDKQKYQLDEGDIKLLNYLARNEHKSPFYHVTIQLRITAPVFIARQYWRHHVGFFGRNEVSRRYVDDWPEFWFPDKFRSRPDDSVKQGSGPPLSGFKQVLAKSIYASAIKVSDLAYKSLIKLDVAPEQSRSVLAQSMYTTWIESGTLYAHANMCRERLSPNAQLEMQELAQLICNETKKVAPYSWETLRHYVVERY